MAKRRPAPQITVASAPQVLSPKRFCQTSLVTAGIANHQLVTGAPVQQQVFDTQTLLRNQAAAAAAGIIQPITANHHHHHAALQQQIAAVIANNNKNSLPFLHQQPPQVQIQHTSSGLVHSVTPILTTTASSINNNNNHTILNNNNTPTNNITTSNQNELNIAVSSHNSQSALNHINAQQQGSPIDNSESVTTSNNNNNNNGNNTNDAQQQGGNINTPSNNTNNNNNMDNPMGQMTPIAPLTLSQSMDSVNTNSNEEEVSAAYLFIRNKKKLLSALNLEFNVCVKKTEQNRK